MKKSFAAFVVGFIFAIGLGLSGMTRPDKIVGFLDIFDNWDPSLLFVMMGAVLVHFISYKLITKRKTPLLDTKWHLPTKKEITLSLIAGSFIFGVGWGLGGYCPGPAVASLASFDTRPVIFVASMLIGMFLFILLDKKIKFKK